MSKRQRQRKTKFEPKEYFLKQPRTANQKEYVESLQNNIITLCGGYAGTGKTMFALQQALIELQNRKIDKILYVRNECGIQSMGSKERGATKGDLFEKSLHLLGPIIDNLYEIVDPGKAAYMIEKAQIKFEYFEDLRGRSLANCFVIVDESQNCVPHAIVTVLTRMSHNSKIALIGDHKQKDLNDHFNDGLLDAMRRLRGMDEVGIVMMNDIKDIQRNGFNSEIMRRYDML